MTINNTKELQNIVTNHSVDILLQRFCKDLQRIHKRTILFFDN